MADQAVTSPITLRSVPLVTLNEPFRHYAFDHGSSGLGQVRVTETLLYMIERMVRMNEPLEPHLQRYTVEETQIGWWVIRSLYWWRAAFGGKPLIVSNRSNDLVPLNAKQYGWLNDLDVVNLDDAIEFGRSLTFEDKASLTLRNLNGLWRRHKRPVATSYAVVDGMLRFAHFRVLPDMFENGMCFACDEQSAAQVLEHLLAKGYIKLHKGDRFAGFDVTGQGALLLEDLQKNPKLNREIAGPAGFINAVAEAPRGEPVFFLDTEVFLHHISIEQIDWAMVTGAKSGELWVTIPTVEELEEKKSLSTSRKLSERAGKALINLKKLRAENNSIVRPHFWLVLDALDPTLSYDEFQLDRKIFDNRLILRAMEVGRTRPVVIVTGDASMHLRAERFELSVLELPKETRLPQLADESSAEVARLREENARLRTQAPRLETTFASGSDHFTIEAVEPRPVNAAAQAALIDEQRLRHKPRSRKEDEKRPLNAFSNMFGSGPISQSEYDRYNRELEQYFKELTDTAEDRLHTINRGRRILTVSLALHNTGSQPAKNAEVTVRCASNALLWVDYPDLWSEFPRLPKEPEGTGGAFASIRAFTQATEALNAQRAYDSMFSFTPQPPEPPTFKQVSDRELRIAFKSIRHGDSMALPELFVELNEGATGTSLEATSYADNQPERVKSVLVLGVKLITQKEKTDRDLRELFSKRKKYIATQDEDESEV